MISHPDCALFGYLNLLSAHFVLMGLGIISCQSGVLPQQFQMNLCGHLDKFRQQKHVGKSVKGHEIGILICFTIQGRCAIKFVSQRMQLKANIC